MKTRPNIYEELLNAFNRNTKKKRCLRISQIRFEIYAIISFFVCKSGCVLNNNEYEGQKVIEVNEIYDKPRSLHALGNIFTGSITHAMPCRHQCNCCRNWQAGCSHWQLNWYDFLCIIIIFYAKIGSFLLFTDLGNASILELK